MRLRGFCCQSKLARTPRKYSNTRQPGPPSQVLVGGRARSGIRTRTPLPAHTCEACASTSSAIRARSRKTAETEQTHLTGRSSLPRRHHNAKCVGDRHHSIAVSSESTQIDIRVTYRSAPNLLLHPLTTLTCPPVLGLTDLKYGILPSGITLFDSPDVFIRLSSQNSSAGAASGRSLLTPLLRGALR